MSFEIDYSNCHETEGTSSDHSSVTITIDDPRWRTPWRTQLREAIALVWAKGWAALWSDDLWWRNIGSVSVA